MSRARKGINKNLMFLLLGRMVSDIGSSIQIMIMPLYIIDIGGTAGTVGLFSFLALVPTLLVYPFAGVLGDRLNRKRIMVASDFISAVIILLLAYVSYIDRINLVLLLLAQVLVALLYGFFDPATKGMIPQLVAEDALNKTNSKIATLRIISGLVSPMIAVTLYTSFGITVLFLINGVSFLISGSSEMLIQYKHVKRESIEGVQGIISDLTEGVRYIQNSELIGKLSVYFLMAFAFIQPVFAVVLPLFYRTKLNYPDTQYGLLQMILLLGALVGSILVGMFGKEDKLRKSLSIGIGLTICSMFIFSIIIFPQSLKALGNDTLLYIALLASVLFVLYTSLMFISIPVQTIIQKETPNEYMSRIFSIVGMISKGGMPIGALVYGLILEKLEIHLTVFTATIVVMLISIRFLASIFKKQEF
ncbi:MAG: MFS transporter [Clostridia bacterium]|nr:MFS transporter [Clostridia bacterium]